ncbi:MAG TPA: MarR family transcriptional regulator [Silvibacterium sp.]|jgi:DNA-binding transcriptional regulator GbsR (MarR family)|nr:MarR family transcriptional regulator [Silvibacterium sp.]
MTEISEAPAVPKDSKPSLSPVAQKFILHWGEMGTRWGVNRTVAQIHALLYLSQRPMPADEISDTLAVARSNVSTSLRELQGWRIVRVAPILGDRRQHFESMKDIWEMFRVILDERKKREIDPTIRVLGECVAEAGKAGPSEAYARERINEMLEFIASMDTLFQEFQHLPPTAARGLIKLRGRVKKLLPG